MTQCKLPAVLVTAATAATACMSCSYKSFGEACVEVDAF
jgi:hypothetical protein